MKIRVLVFGLGLLTPAWTSSGSGTFGNGLIVPARNDAEAIKAAGMYIIDRLNASLQARDFSENFHEKSFGKAKQNEVPIGKTTESLLGVIEKILVPKDSRPLPVISMLSSEPQLSGNSETVFFMILEIKGAAFTGGVLFFSIEKLTRFSDDAYDVAVVPGRIFLVINTSAEYRPFGRMKTSKITILCLLAALPFLPAISQEVKSVELFEEKLSANGFTATLKLRSGAFDKEGHQLRLDPDSEGRALQKDFPLIDGRYPIGVDGYAVPVTEIKEFTVELNGKIIDVPRTLFSDVYSPDLDPAVVDAYTPRKMTGITCAVSEQGSLLIEMRSRKWASRPYTIIWVIRMGGKHERFLVKEPS